MGRRNNRVELKIDTQNHTYAVLSYLSAAYGCIAIRKIHFHASVLLFLLDQVWEINEMLTLRSIWVFVRPTSLRKTVAVVRTDNSPPTLAYRFHTL